MKFTDSHEWVEVSGDEGRVGITTYARQELGEVVYIELPKVGQKLKLGEEACILESTKAAADVYSPLSGEVTAINTALEENPDLLNRSPQGQGWLFTLKISRPDEMDHLLDEDVYERLTH